MADPAPMENPTLCAILPERQARLVGKNLLADWIFEAGGNSDTLKHLPCCTGRGFLRY